MRDESTTTLLLIGLIIILLVAVASNQPEKLENGCILLGEKIYCEEATN